MKFLLSQLRVFYQRIAVILLLVLFGQVSLLLEPIVLRYSIDHWVLNPDRFTASECKLRISLIAGLLLALYTISRLLKITEEYQTGIIAHYLADSVYTRGLRHALALPVSIHFDQRVGSTVQRLDKVRLDTIKFIQIILGTFVATLVSFAFVIAYTIFTSWVVALVLIIGFPSLTYISNLLHNRIKQLQSQILTQKEVLASETVESLRNIEIVKSLGLVDQEIHRLNSSTDRLVLLELECIKRLRFYSFVHGSILNIARVTIFVWMLYLVSVKALTLGEFLSFYIFAFTLLLPFKKLGQAMTLFSEIRTSLEEFDKFLEIPIDASGSEKLQSDALQKLELRDVDYRYESHTALSRVSCAVKVGQTVAFVGPSGSGKSTMSKILTGLIEPASGQMLINDVDSRKLNLEEVRRQISIVPQDAKLFYGTVRENLRFYCPNATDTECLKALEDSGSLAYFRNLNLDLDTLIGEGGMTFSGGERQRFAIARALLRKPRLLILDEATSSLDYESEEELIQNIRQLPETKSRSTVLVSHRLSSVMHADTIYVLENGRIIEEGTHNKLLMLKGLYYAMWRLQVDEFELNPRKTIPLKLVG